MNKKNEDGYELWLRYRTIDNAERLAQYSRLIGEVVVSGRSETSRIIRDELQLALKKMLDKAVPFYKRPSAANLLLVGTLDDIEANGLDIAHIKHSNLGNEGYFIGSQAQGETTSILVTANSETALLTGTFHFLRLLQTHQAISDLDITSRPRFHHRILGHWDNLDGSIERGYAGRSLWNWSALPSILDPRYRDYARACASIGLNGTCLNNVNAQAESLSSDYLLKTAALADLFRPYGIRVYLSPVFTAPMQLGGLATSDPRDPLVAAWWQDKVNEIYRLIPDFGGFQMKANSEGRPGPQDYGAGHDEGANMLATALQPHGGILLWRAFVYDVGVDEDRAKCANIEFEPLDGSFRPNVLLQAKNGPLDFQPREPFHPLFGRMKRTPLALEVQLTQEYLGQSIHLVYLAGMWKEVLEADTYAKGAGSTVAKVVDGSLLGHDTSCILGVSNTGTNRNWCGHHFSQANWYAFGRLAWDSDLSAETIADEWARLTWTNDPAVLNPIKSMMQRSWPACIDYMTPLGLHHIMQEGHHYGPDPAFNSSWREDWNCVYFHRADKVGVGFDRSSTGSNAVSQYNVPLSEQFDDLATCPEKYLLWFHHVPWDHRLRSGQPLWHELQYRYDRGVAYVEAMLEMWRGLRPHIDAQRHRHVSERLTLQLQSAQEWRDVCLSYFGQFSGLKDKANSV